MNLCEEIIVDRAFVGTPAAFDAAPEAIGSDGEEVRYEATGSWGERQFEAADTNRLNEAHWRFAQDVDINQWLLEKLPTLRARATYECRNNGMLSGVANTLVEDVVGPDGPMLEVQSSDSDYNAASEEVWRDWFKAPTFRQNVSGAAWLKLCVRNLPRCGEFLTIIGTDDTAEGPVKMRLRPRHPRWLSTPGTNIANPRVIMGVEFDRNERPTRYWIEEREGFTSKHVPYSPEDIIHEFTLDEEGQARGFPWTTPSLQSAADLRDFDDQIQDAARLMADQAVLLHTDHPDAPVYTASVTTRFQRRTVRMAPPGWKPWLNPATQPPVQYPDFRAEKQRDMGRPFSMPLMMVRLDASKHNYSAARFDAQGYWTVIDGIRCWLGGTPESTGTLNRLVDLVIAEARFSDRYRALRRRPKDVVYIWTWPPRPHVDPSKEADGEAISLETGADDLINIWHGRGVRPEVAIKRRKRVVQLFEDAGLPLPAAIAGAPQASTAEARQARAAQRAAEEAAGVIYA